jgi:hypothetical protein
MTILYVNGDSYSALSTKFKVYSEILGEKLSVPVVNEAMPGSSNDRIFRTTLEYVATLSPDTNPFIVIGFSFITREEIWIDNIAKYKNRIKDYPTSQFISAGWLESTDINESIQHLIIDQNINKQTVNFYTKLYMLTSLLKGLSIPYFMFSAARNTDYKNLNHDSLNNLSMYQKICQDSNILNFQTFNIPQWANDNNIKTTGSGHLLEDGHIKFAEYLQTKI